jgi:hypothetical protein
MNRLPVMLLAAGSVAAPAAVLAVPDRQALQASLGGCPVFPSSNVWNRPVDSLPVRSDSAMLLRSMGLTTGLHPDFGSVAGGNYGIPYNLVSSATNKVKVRFDYADESDPGPYPIPKKPKIEGGGDRHILMLDKTACRLYELWNARKVSGTGWTAGSGAIWDLRSNALRPDGWTSADAAGLPILPGLARYDEVAAGHIDHALRFTVPVTRRAHIYPARHDAGSTDSVSAPQMGLRLRLKASVDISRYPTQARVLLQALKTYGMILADNGSAFYVSGAPDPGWDDDGMHTIGGIKGSDFEVVDTSGLVNGARRTSHR